MRFPDLVRTYVCPETDARVGVDLAGAAGTEAALSISVSDGA